MVDNFLLKLKFNFFSAFEKFKNIVFWIFVFIFDFYTGCLAR